MCKQNLSCSLSVHVFDRIKRRNSTLHNLLTFLLSNNNVRATSGNTRGWLNKISCPLLWPEKTCRKGAVIEWSFPANTPDSSHRHSGHFLKILRLDLCLDATINLSGNLSEHLVFSLQTSCANVFHNFLATAWKLWSFWCQIIVFSSLWAFPNPFLSSSSLLDHYWAQSWSLQKTFHRNSEIFFLWAILQLVIAYA